MSMPQVHLVAYCTDLGYGPARGTEMLSLMLGLGVLSRLVSGMIADRIGGAGTLLLGSALQALALLFYLPFDGLASLFLVSALFGLSQGGIVPSYALIVRDYFPAREAGTRVSLVFTATVLGMAAGGWLSGAIHDLTGSYAAAFVNGIGAVLDDVSVAAEYLLRAKAALANPLSVSTPLMIGVSNDPVASSALLRSFASSERCATSLLAPYAYSASTRLPSLNARCVRACGAHPDARQSDRPGLIRILRARKRPDLQTFLRVSRGVLVRASDNARPCTPTPRRAVVHHREHRIEAAVRLRPTSQPVGAVKFITQVADP